MQQHNMQLHSTWPCFGTTLMLLPSGALMYMCAHEYDCWPLLVVHVVRVNKPNSKQRSVTIARPGATIIYTALQVVHVLYFTYCGGLLCAFAAVRVLLVAGWPDGPPCAKPWGMPAVSKPGPLLAVEHVYLLLSLASCAAKVLICDLCCGGYILTAVHWCIQGCKRMHSPVQPRGSLHVSHL